MTKKAKSKSVFKVLLKILLVLLVLAIIGAASLVLINKHVIDSTRDDVYTLDAFIGNNNSHYDCVVVLGCAVWGKSPSPLLKDRLMTAVSVYNSGCCDYILVSGDGLNPSDYDEIGPMTDFLIEEGIPADKIKKDPLGLSTYESMLRAEKEFGISSAVIVTVCPLKFTFNVSSVNSSDSLFVLFNIALIRAISSLGENGFVI